MVLPVLGRRYGYATEQTTASAGFSCGVNREVWTALHGQPLRHAPRMFMTKLTTRQKLQLLSNVHSLGGRFSTSGRPQDQGPSRFQPKPHCGCGCGVVRKTDTFHWQVSIVTTCRLHFPLMSTLRQNCGTQGALRW